MNNPRSILCTILLVTLLLPTVAVAQNVTYAGVVSAPQFLDSASPGLRRIQDLGVGWVRIGIDWQMIQTSPGGAFDFHSQADPWVNNALRSGINVLLDLGGPPSWAAPCASYCVPNSMTDWYNYVYAVVLHYGTSVTYQVWNEPNDNYFLRTNPSDARHYAIAYSIFRPILETALAARNNSVPSATFVVPDMTDAALAGWFDTFWQTDALALARQDKLSIHVYQNGNIPWDINYLITTTGREVWLTETGPTTPTSDSGQDAFMNSLINMFATRSDPRWTRFFYYRIYGGTNDGETLTYTDPARDWVPRPAYYTYQTWIGGPVSLASGQQLNPNQFVTSPSGQYRLIYQSDGNLVLYDAGGLPVWASNTPGVCAGFAPMQGDGNFVLYNCTGSAYWATNTYGNSGAYLSVQNDGNIVIHATSGIRLWSRF